MINTTTVTLQDRDGPLEFFITELGVWKLQKIIIRVGIEFLRTGLLEADKPSDLMYDTISAIQQGGLRKLGNLNPDFVEDILATLIQLCVQYKTGKALTPIDKNNIEHYIQNVTTLWGLEMEIFKFHFSFLHLDFLSASQNQSEETAEQNTTSKPAMYLRS